MVAMKPNFREGEVVNYNACLPEILTDAGKVKLSLRGYGSRSWKPRLCFHKLLCNLENFIPETAVWPRSQEADGCVPMQLNFVSAVDLRTPVFLTRTLTVLRAP